MSRTRARAVEGLGMKRTRTLFAAAALLAALTVPGVSHASHGGGCGWSTTGDPALGIEANPWHGSATCVLNFRGFPISVFADATSTSTASVHIWITAAVPQTSIDSGEVVVECSARASQYATCSKKVPDVSEVADATTNISGLFCHVQGSVSGDGWCISASGR